MKVIKLAMMGLLLAGASAFAADADIAARIAPVGETCMAGEDCASAAVPVVADAAAGRPGEVVYQQCAVCHATGAAGAPKLGDVAAWGPRVEKGMDILYASAMKGFKGMPAKGLCFDCSDDELKAAVDHMVEKSK
ncbi:c-type cytochrome [Teredinibacter haidensis]|uniref:c-type cytochrome n=1 Tax=Teredinibacter haidensis TaxID=2731755 RepID=UPI000948AA47|nr:c-type cytochrome [Teredinibacter haidensis]